MRPLVQQAELLARARVFEPVLAEHLPEVLEEIDAAIEGCTKIVALMSPNYFASPECKEELMVARLRRL